MSIWVRITKVDQTKGWRFSEEPPGGTEKEDLGSLFRWLQGEFGRCTSRMYVDRTNGKTIPIGWVFEKR